MLIRSCFFACLLLCITVGSADAQNACDSILSGLISKKSTLHDRQFESDYMNWLSTNEFGSYESLSKESEKAGLKLPKILPFSFNSDSESQNSVKQSYSKSLENYLRNHVDDRDHFFESVREANTDVVNAWLDCMKPSAGLRCSVSQTENEKELEVTLLYIPRGGDPSTIHITAVKYQSDQVAPTEEYKGWDLPSAEETVLTFRRLTDEGGRIQIFTDNPAAQCRGGSGMRFLSIAHQMVGCSKPDKQGNCLRCDVDVSFDAGTGGDGQKDPPIVPAPVVFSADCQHMPPNKEVNVRFSGTIAVLNLNEQQTCRVDSLLSANGGPSRDADDRDACPARVQTVETGFFDQTSGSVTAKIALQRCYEGSDKLKKCSGKGKLSFFTADGQ